MARINFDDSVESQDEFWRLVNIVKDRDRALGMLVRFFRLAQHHFGRKEPIPAEEIGNKGLEPMIESGWALPDRIGFMAKGAEKHLAWYRQRVQAGLSRVGSERNPAGQFIQRDSDPDQPLALALAPVQIQKSVASATNPLLEIWNQNRGTLPLARECSRSSNRGRRAAARWREHPDTAYWTEVVRRIAASPFCRGETERGTWRASFDFLVQPDTHVKALEGKYDPPAKRNRLAATPLDPLTLEATT